MKKERVEDIKKYLLKVHEQSDQPLDDTWCEGYISALQDEDVIDDEEFKEHDVDVEAGVPISKAIPGAGRVSVYELPGMAEAACTIYKGPYENIGEAYSAIISWVESNGYQITGPDRELYLTSPTDTTDPNQYVTEIQFPVKKA